MAVTLITGNKNFACLRVKVRTSHPVTLVAICPSHAYHLIRFRRNFVGNLFWGESKKNECIFPKQTLYWPYLRKGRLMWSRNQILGRLYDFVLWPHPWPWPWSFKVKVWNSLIFLGMGGPIDIEWKGCELIIHDHERDLSVTMVGWMDVLDSDLLPNKFSKWIFIIRRCALY